jgi:8-oxo-dGTP diphosphatase
MKFLRRCAMANGMRPGIDYIGVTCSFFCHDGNGKFLFQKRSDMCRDECGRWDCGGGQMEFGETMEETLRRELAEEYGVESISFEHVRSYSALREIDGARTHWVNNLFLVQIDPKKVKILEPEKVDDHGWFSLDDLPEPLHTVIPHDVEVVKDFLQTKF